MKNVKYSLAMARSSSRNSGGSQIYVNLKDNVDLDGEYVVFGTATTPGAVDALVIGDTITAATVEE
ncbi:hypothetical protein EON81_08015 [bacterium]|nr:MAG: hypothetical protein EON81_08015 [bacterium]